MDFEKKKRNKTYSSAIVQMLHSGQLNKIKRALLFFDHCDLLELTLQKFRVPYKWHMYLSSHSDFLGMLRKYISDKNINKFCVENILSERTQEVTEYYIRVGSNRYISNIIHPIF